MREKQRDKYDCENCERGTVNYNHYKQLGLQKTVTGYIGLEALRLARPWPLGPLSGCASEQASDEKPRQHVS